MKLLAALSVWLTFMATDATLAAAKQSPAVKLNCTSTVNKIQTYRTKTWQLQKFMGRNRTHSANHERWTRSCKYVGWIAGMWKDRARKAWRDFQNPPHKAQWLCIHGYEGSWTDPNSPFYGGLQMDYEFQQTYGYDLLRSKGTADHWTPLEQMWVAERAYVTRGFNPWPNTAHYCHLI